jgi:hypothetical protein
MSKYAGLLFPAEDYCLIGPFRFPILKALVPLEARAIKKVEQEHTRKTLNSMRFAKKIAEDKKITKAEAIKLLRNASENEDIVYEYVDELTQMQEDQADDTDQLVGIATVILKARGEVQVPGEPDYKAIPDWSAEDSETVPKNILARIVEFVNWERDGWPKPEDLSKELEGGSPSGEDSGSEPNPEPDASTKTDSPELQTVT